jgi:hypothetical protein
VQLAGDGESLVADLLPGLGLSRVDRRSGLELDGLSVPTPRPAASATADRCRRPDQTDDRAAVARFEVVVDGEGQGVDGEPDPGAERDRRPRSRRTQAWPAARGRRRPSPDGRSHTRACTMTSTSAAASSGSGHRRRSSDEHERADTGGQVGPGGVVRVGCASRRTAATATVKAATPRSTRRGSAVRSTTSWRRPRRSCVPDPALARRRRRAGRAPRRRTRRTPSPVQQVGIGHRGHDDRAGLRGQVLQHDVGERVGQQVQQWRADEHAADEDPDRLMRSTAG